MDNVATDVFVSGTTSNCDLPEDPFIPTNEPLNKNFHLPTGYTTAASVQAKLCHDMMEPAQIVDIIPELKHNLLLSTRKFAKTGYVTVIRPTEILIYDKHNYYCRVDCAEVL